MDVTHRSALVEDVPAVLAFWASAAQDSHRPADSAEAVTRLVARDPDDNVSAHAAWAAAGYVRQSEWSRWVKSLPPGRPGRPGPAG